MFIWNSNNNIYSNTIEVTFHGYITCENDTHALEGTTVIDTNSISNGLYVPVTKINNYNNNDYIPQHALILTHSVMFTNSYQT